MLLLTSTQKAALTLDPRDSKGNVATLDGVPVWTVADPSIAELVVDPTGLSATVNALAVGATQVNVTADADLDAGETREISGTLDVTVAPAEAVTLGIAAGPAEEQ